MKQYEVVLSFAQERKKVVDADTAEQAVRMAAEKIKQGYESGEDMQDVIFIYLEAADKLPDGSKREVKTSLSKSNNFKCDYMEVRTCDAEDPLDFAYACVGDCKACPYRDECEDGE